MAYTSSQCLTSTPTIIAFLDISRAGSTHLLLLWCWLLPCIVHTNHPLKLFDIIFIHDEKLITKVLASNFLIFILRGRACFFVRRRKYPCVHMRIQIWIQIKALTSKRSCSCLCVVYECDFLCKQEHRNIQQTVIIIKDYYWWTGNMNWQTMHDIELKFIRFSQLFKKFFCLNFFECWVEYCYNF